METIHAQFQRQLVTPVSTAERGEPDTFLLFYIENILEHQWNIQLKLLHIVEVINR